MIDGEEVEEDEDGRADGLGERGCRTSGEARVSAPLELAGRRRPAPASRSATRRRRAVRRGAGAARGLLGRT